jgi:hypothetical protein
VWFVGAALCFLPIVTLLLVVGIVRVAMVECVFLRAIKVNSTIGVTRFVAHSCSPRRGSRLSWHRCRSPALFNVAFEVVDLIVPDLSTHRATIVG